LTERCRTPIATAFFAYFLRVFKLKGKADGIVFAGAPPLRRRALDKRRALP
jgi:hypothetical protein